MKKSRHVPAKSADRSMISHSTGDSKSNPAQGSALQGSALQGPTLQGPALQGPTVQAVWDAYWFAPLPAGTLWRVQQIVSMVAGLWFLCQLNAIGFWWDDAGFSAAGMAGRLEGFTEGDFTASFRLTPLWMTQSSTLITVWSFTGILLSVLSAINVGGRWTRTALVLCILFLAQRLSWASGLLEPYLVAMTGYLTIARLTQVDDWSHRFTTRLIEVHTWLLLCAALGSQLSFEAWWHGEAAWWLAATGKSNVLATGWLEGRLLLVNLITHGITLCTLVSIGCLWPFGRTSTIRLRWGMTAGFLVAAAYALVSNQSLYGLLLVAGIITWYPHNVKK